MTEFEQAVADALGDVFGKMRLTRAGRIDYPDRWSGDDLATDLAPRVAAAIEAAASGADSPMLDSLAALRGDAP